nr:hypothetical protein [Sphingomonas bacterium]
MRDDEGEFVIRFRERQQSRGQQHVGAVGEGVKLAGSREVDAGGAGRHGHDVNGRFDPATQDGKCERAIGSCGIDQVAHLVGARACAPLVMSLADERLGRDRNTVDPQQHVASPQSRTGGRTGRYDGKHARATVDPELRNRRRPVVELVLTKMVENQARIWGRDRAPRDTTHGESESNFRHALIFGANDVARRGDGRC